MRARKICGRALIAAAVGCALRGTIGSAATITWTNSSGGLYHDPANWSAGGPAGIADMADFSGAGTYSVTLDGDVSNDDMRVGDNVTLVNFVAGRTYNVTDLVNVWVGNGSLTISPAQPITLNADRVIAFGGFTLGGGSDVNLTTNFSITTAGGTSTAIISGAGTTLNAANALALGTFAGTALMRYQSDATGLVGQIFAGTDSSNGGSGTLEVLSGADLTATSFIRIGTGGVSGQSGTLLVSGAGSTFVQNFSAFINIGAASGSSGTWRVNSSGSATTGTGLLTVFPTGLLEVSGGGTFTANGNITVDGGTANFVGGSLTWVSGQTMTVQNGGDVTLPSLNMPANTTVNVTSGSSYSGFGLNIGNGNAGAFTVDGAGSSLTFTSGIAVGGNGGAGTLTIRNNAIASLGVVNIVQTFASAGSSGTINVQGGADVTAGIVSVGSFDGGESGSLATVNVDGSGSTFTQTGASTLTVGANAGTTGTINLLNDSNYESGFGLTTVNSTGLVNIDPGPSSFGNFRVNGDLTVNGGRIQRNTGFLTWAGFRTMNIQNGGDMILGSYGWTMHTSTINISGNGSTFDMTPGGGIWLGEGSSLNITTGGDYIASDVTTGGDASTDTILVNGAGSTLTASTLARLGIGPSNSVVNIENEATGTFGTLELSKDGLNGTTFFNVSSGADVACQWLEMASSGVGTATLNVDGVGSTFAMNSPSGSNLVGSPTGQPGTINVMSGSSMTAHASSTFTIEATGVVNADIAGNISLGTMVNKGEFHFLGGGTLSIANMQIGDGSLFHTDTPALLTLTTPLTLGNGTMQVDGADLKFTGNITVPAGGRTITKTGPGTLTLFATWINPSGVSTINVTAGTLNLDRGPANGALNIVNDGALVIRDTGAMRNIADLSGPGSTTIGSTSTLTANHVRQGSVTINGSGQLKVRPNATAAGVSRIATLVMAANARFDLADNKLIVVGAAGASTWNGSAYSGVAGLVQSGYNGAAWDGDGIITSMSDATTGVLTTLAVAGAEDVGYAGGTFGGQSVVAGDVLVMYTWGGDAQLDGDLDGDDYFQIDSNVAQSGSVFGFHKGDFNYDGLINGDDYFIIDSNIAFANTQPDFPTGAPAAGASFAAVPEPVGAGALMAMGVALARPRRRSVGQVPRKQAG